MPTWDRFIGGCGLSQSLVGDAEDTINFDVVQLDNGRPALMNRPGFAPWTPLSTVADVGSRASVVAGSQLFWIFGGSLYEFDINGTPTKRGTVAIDGNPAQLIWNGVIGGQLGIASGGNIYAYNIATTTLSAALLTGGYTHIAFAVGFGLALNSTTGKVNVSAANDLTTWNAGTFFQRSLFADPYAAMWVDANNLVWLPGTDTFEVRYAGSTGTDQPFIPLSGLTGGYGIVAPFAFASSLRTGTVNLWLAKNPAGIGEFVATTGGVPSGVSNNAFNTAVNSYANTSAVTDAEVLTYQMAGRHSVNVAFPSAQSGMPTTPTTWTVDPKSSIWTRRGRWTNGQWSLWSPRTHVFAYGKNLIGDRASGTIYQMDTTLYSEIDGTGIVCERTAPILTDELKRIPIDQIELWMDTGVGTASGQGANPLALLRVSDDGGRTYGNERQCGYGRIGEYPRRVFWTRFGGPSSLIARVRFTDPTQKSIVAAFLNNAEQARAAA